MYVQVRIDNLYVELQEVTIAIWITWGFIALMEMMIPLSLEVNQFQLEVHI